jgi:choline dehydrogenase-like flavoprotein
VWGQALRDTMLDYNHMSGLVAVAETEPRPCNRVTLAEERDRHGLPVAHVEFSYSDNDRRLQAHASRFMGQMLEAAGGRSVWTSDDTSHILGTCRMGSDPDISVVDRDGRSWDVRNLWICDGSLFPTAGGVNPSLTIQALACRIGDRIQALARSSA